MNSLEPQSDITFEEMFDHVMHIIKLDKSGETHSRCKMMFNEWISFLKYVEKTQKILAPEDQIIPHSNWSRADLETHDRYLYAIRNYRSQLLTTYENACLQEKKEPALTEVVQISAQDNKIDITDDQKRIKWQFEVATMFLDELNVPDIAHMTGLSIEQVEQLKKKTLS